ncbi:hypothetical protein DET49_13215 [Salegentibacter sp. 24]|nr:hypothetical protein DET49_13215 [Salegentibacter sp. 24]
MDMTQVQMKYLSSKIPPEISTFDLLNNKTVFIFFSVYGISQIQKLKVRSK